jgi:hypothetical protein
MYKFHQGCKLHLHILLSEKSRKMRDFSLNFANFRVETDRTNSIACLDGRIVSHILYFLLTHLLLWLLWCFDNITTTIKRPGRNVSGC